MSAIFALDALRAETTTTDSQSQNDQAYFEQLGLRLRVLRTARQLT